MFLQKFDFAQAYDNVNLNLLAKSLHDQGIKHRIIILIMNTLRITQTNSKFIITKKTGLPQDAVHAPYLFNILISQ